MPRKPTDFSEYIDQVINHLQIIEVINIHKRNNFLCKCICGTIIAIRASNVLHGYTKSCGCMKSEILSEAKKLPNNQATINFVYRAYISRAKKKNISFDLSIEQFIHLISLPCVYCDMPPEEKILIRRHNKTNAIITRNEIDRVDSSVGYTLTNSVPCCHQCNMAKSDSTIEEFRAWIAKIYAKQYAQETQN